MSLAFIVQIALLGFYLALAVLFSFEQKAWPMALYYVGCIVKDGGVMVMGLFLSARVT